MHAARQQHADEQRMPLQQEDVSIDWDDGDDADDCIPIVEDDEEEDAMAAAANGNSSGSSGGGGDGGSFSSPHRHPTPEPGCAAPAQAAQGAAPLQLRPLSPGSRWAAEASQLAATDPLTASGEAAPPLIGRPQAADAAVGTASAQPDSLCDAAETPTPAHAAASFPTDEASAAAAARQGAAPETAHFMELLWSDGEDGGGCDILFDDVATEEAPEAGAAKGAALPGRAGGLLQSPDKAWD